MPLDARLRRLALEKQALQLQWREIFPDAAPSDVSDVSAYAAAGPSSGGGGGQTSQRTIRFPKPPRLPTGNVARPKLPFGKGRAKEGQPTAAPPAAPTAPSPAAPPAQAPAQAREPYVPVVPSHLDKSKVMDL